MSQTELTHEAKAAIRSYMSRIIAPIGALAFVLAALGGYVVRSVGESQANLAILQLAQPKLVEQAQAAATAAEQIKYSKEKLGEYEAQLRALEARVQPLLDALRTDNAVSAIVLKLKSDDSFRLAIQQGIEVSTQRCRLVAGDKATNSPDFGKGSIAICADDEIVTGGACQADNRGRVAGRTKIYGKGKFKQPTTFECVRATSGDDGDLMQSQAICCK